MSLRYVGSHSDAAGVDVAAIVTGGLSTDGSLLLEVLLVLAVDGGGEELSVVG